LNARLLGFKQKWGVDKMKRILDKPYEKDELVYPKRLCNTIGNLGFPYYFL
jgi:hypothetical protein